MKTSQKQIMIRKTVYGSVVISNIFSFKKMKGKKGKVGKYEK